MTARHFFTFCSDSPYSNCYVEIEAESRDRAREAMFSAHGNRWGFQYDEEEFLPQIDKYGLKRLSLIGPTEDAPRAVEVMGEN